MSGLHYHRAMVASIFTGQPTLADDHGDIRKRSISNKKDLHSSLGSRWKEEEDAISDSLTSALSRV